MVILSFNKRRGVKIAVIAALAMFLTALCLIIALEKKQPLPDYAEADKVGRFSTEAPDTEARVKFLKQFKIAVNPKSEKTDTITIPAEFGRVYEEYNELQKRAGLDLSPFKGEQVSRVVYKLKDKEKFVTLLIFKAHVIGGHLSTGVYGDRYEALNGATG